ncbi:MAG: hypothetical protein ACK4PI_04695 [Tepidisphaerales bacterium]
MVLRLGSVVSLVLGIATYLVMAASTLGQPVSSPPRSGTERPGGASAQGPLFVWIEGENPTQTNIRPHPWYSNQVDKSALSGGDFLAHFDPARPGTATYQFNVPAAGDYHFWLRANPVSSKLSYRLNGGPETAIDFSNHLDNRNIASDGRVDLRFIAWTRVGRVNLRAGRNTVIFRMHSENANHGSIDCFTFVSTRWRPEGTLKPDQTPPLADVAGLDTAWAFEPDDDDFKPGALWDLRGLNERVAGETGFIRLSEDGRSFVRGDGTPIRFWGVVSDGIGFTPEQMETHCKFLAKRGINMIRLHLNLPDTSPGSRMDRLNQRDLDRTFRFISVARRHGIYITISPFWAHMRAPASWGIEDYADRQIWGLMFFNPDLQEAYRSWTRQLYTTVNPYTGLALKDDPAVAIVQVKNEDSLLFWTFQDVRPAQRRLIGRQFGQWAAGKYGSLEKAFEAWGGPTVEGDDPAAGVVGFRLIWHLTQPPPADPRQRQRLDDQTEFLARTQYNFYAMVEKHLRELGVRSLTNAMNWRSADPVLLDDAERWSYTAMSLPATNNYINGLHLGENNGYRIDPGHRFTNISALLTPTAFPGNLKQTAGRPMIVTESTWVHPNLYQSEGPLMVAAYFSLTGVDTMYWFAANTPTFLADPRRMFWRVGDSYALDKWSCSTPMLAAQWPAYALAFRKGYVKPADRPVVSEHRALTDLWQRRVPIISESGRFDPNRDEGSFAVQSPIKQEVDRLAFLVGPVEVTYDSDPARSVVTDLSPYIDRERGVVRSVTGELQLDHRRGVLTVDAPKLQAVGGFLKGAGGEFRTADVTFRSDNEYATLGVVPLDDQPIAASRKLLVQVGTTARLSGWTTRPERFRAGGRDDDPEVDGEVIVATGSPPWLVAHTLATLRVRNPHLSRATVTDINGYPAGDVPVRREGDTLVLELPKDAMFVVLQ